MIAFALLKIWRGRLILVHIQTYNVYLNVANHAISTEIFHEKKPLQQRKNKIPPCLPPLRYRIKDRWLFSIFALNNKEERKICIITNHLQMLIVALLMKGAIIEQYIV